MLTLFSVIIEILFENIGKSLKPFHGIFVNESPEFNSKYVKRIKKNLPLSMKPIMKVPIFMLEKYF